MTYTTQELIAILDQELSAVWRGERLTLSSAERLDNPVIAKALDLNQVGKVFAYQDFRRQIHDYQIEQSVSGIVWRSCSFGGQIVEVPEVHNQLIPIPGDKEILIDAKEELVHFWQTNSAGLKQWFLAHRPRPLSAETWATVTREGEWAELEATQTELFLRLCWGDPLEAAFPRAWPQSGCYRLVAAPGEPSDLRF